MIARKSWRLPISAARMCGGSLAPPRGGQMLNSAWRLELSTDLDIEARAYAGSEGFVTALHDAALLFGGG